MAVFKIHHVTKYLYDSLVRESMNEIRIMPYQCPEQEMLQQTLSITGNPPVFQFADYWGNTTGNFNLIAPHTELVIESKLVIRTTNPPVFSLPSTAGFDELAAETRAQLHLLELATPDSIRSQQAINDILQTIDHRQKSIVAVVEACCTFIFEEFRYIKGITTVETTIDEIMVHRSGVCQDFAHVLLQLLRTMGIPSRYVSGYICPNKNGMRGEGATHAWVEVLVPRHGWVGIDPTNNVWVTDKHVKLAVGRNFNDCTPIKGMFKGIASHRLSVYVSVGYEDGHLFEDVNDVEVGTTSKAVAPAGMQAQQ